MRSTWSLLTAAALAGVLVAAPPATATEYAVDSVVDSPDASPGDNACVAMAGQCTLRAAVEEAGADPGADTITVPAGTFTLTRGSLFLRGTVAVAGAGPGATIIDGDRRDKILLTEVGSSVTVADLALQRGQSPTGAAIFSAGTTTLERVDVRENSGTATGAPGTGAVHNLGTMTIRRSAVHANMLSVAGGGTVGRGVGVVNIGTLTMTDSTVADNWGTAGGGAMIRGAGVSSDGTTVLRRVTLAGNTYSGNGQGANLYVGTTGARVEDTIIAGTAPLDNCYRAYGLDTVGRNLDSGTSCGFGAGDFTGIQPHLAADTLRGTFALRPLLLSPVVDAGSPTCGDGTVDQVGMPRPVGAACDIGAIEAGADLVVSASGPAKAAAGSKAEYAFTVRNDGPDAASVGLRGTPVAGVEPIASSGPSSCSAATLACDPAVVDADSSATWRVTVRFDSPGTRTITMTVEAMPGDPAPAGSVASVTTEVVPAAEQPPAGGGGGGSGTSTTPAPPPAPPVAGTARSAPPAVAPPQAAPVVRIGGPAALVLRRGAVKVPVVLPAGRWTARVEVRAKVGGRLRAVATATRTGASGTATVALKLSRAAARAVRTARRGLKATITVSVRDGAGQTLRATRAVTIRSR